MIGLSSALHLLERFPGAFDMTVVSEKFSPNTTSDKAGALIVQGCAPNVGPNITIDAKTNPEKIQTWTRATINRFHSIYSSEENARVQACLQQGYFMLTKHLPDPWYKDDVFGFRHVDINSVEAKVLNVPPQFVDIWAFMAYSVEPTPYLGWLLDKIRERGATIEQRKILSFDELSSYDIVINCTGLGSSDLLDDKMTFPIRGQVVKVEAPWIKHFMSYSEFDFIGYAIPRANGIVFGGSAVPYVRDETPDEETAEKILNVAKGYFPSLHGAKTDSWVGVRPMRDPIVLKSDEGPSGVLRVDCYGHGGQGVLQSWGCAVDIGNIVEKKLST